MTKNRYKVNFHNPKTQKVIAYLQLGENRISKNEILSLGTKDIFYQLRHEKLIAETSSGEWIGTKKLHSYIKQQYGTSFASSGSNTHSEQLRKTLALLPSSVLEKRAFRTSTDIEKDFRKFAKTQPYKEALYEMKCEKRDALQNLESSYRKAPADITELEKYRLQIDYLQSKERLMRETELLSSPSPCLTPDYQIILTDSERETYIENLSRYKESLNGRAERLVDESIAKLQGLSGTVSISVEVITNEYGNRTLFQHRNYEALSGTPQIFIM